MRDKMHKNKSEEEPDVEPVDANYTTAEPADVVIEDAAPPAPRKFLLLIVMDEKRGHVLMHYSPLDNMLRLPAFEMEDGHDSASFLAAVCPQSPAIPWKQIGTFTRTDDNAQIMVMFTMTPWVFETLQVKHPYEAGEIKVMAVDTLLANKHVQGTAKWLTMYMRYADPSLGPLELHVPVL